MRWRVKTTAFYAGAPGRSLQQIKQEDELKKFICNFVNQNNWNGNSALEIQKAIRARSGSNILNLNGQKNKWLLQK